MTMAEIVISQAIGSPMANTAYRTDSCEGTFPFNFDFGGPAQLFDRIGFFDETACPKFCACFRRIVSANPLAIIDLECSTDYSVSQLPTSNNWLYVDPEYLSES